MLASTSDEGVPDPAHSTGDTRLGDRVACAVAYFPPTDIRTWWENGNAKNYAEAFKFDPKRAAEFSPALQVTRFTAPSLMIHGNKDTAVPLWHSQEFLDACKKNNVASKLVVIPGVGHGFDCGFRGYKEYTPTQAKHMALARDASVEWFDQHLLGPKKETKPLELPAPSRPTRQT